MRRAKRESGQDLVEFALIAPLLFLLLFGIIEFGVAVWRYNTVSNAAREGARAAVTYGMSDAEREAAAVTAAENYAARVGALDVGVDTEMGEFIIGTGEYADSQKTISVTVTYTHRPFTGILSYTIPFSANSSMMVE